MDIITRHVGKVAILDLKGKLTIGEGDVTLREEFVKVLDGGCNKILINLKGVKYMDSAGIGELVGRKVTANRKEAQVGLLHLHKKLYDLLAVAELVGIFDIFDNEEEALASFKP
ncbi:STAS domain-containing protein [Acidobacteriota bacterium]